MLLLAKSVKSLFICLKMNKLRPATVCHWPGAFVAPQIRNPTNAFSLLPPIGEVTSAKWSKGWRCADDCRTTQTRTSVACKYSRVPPSMEPNGFCVKSRSVDKCFDIVIKCSIWGYAAVLFGCVKPKQWTCILTGIVVFLRWNILLCLWRYANQLGEHFETDLNFHHFVYIR